MMNNTETQVIFFLSKSNLPLWWLFSHRCCHLSRLKHESVSEEVKTSTASSAKTYFQRDLKTHLCPEQMKCSDMLHLCSTLSFWLCPFFLTSFKYLFQSFLLLLLVSNMFLCWGFLFMSCMSSVVTHLLYTFWRMCRNTHETKPPL